MKGVFRELFRRNDRYSATSRSTKMAIICWRGETTVILEGQDGKTKLALHTYAKGLAPIPRMLAGMDRGWSQSLTAGLVEGR